MIPKWHSVGLLELGVTETPGPGNNKRITQDYFGATGLGPSPDSVPWCGAFEAFCMKSAGIRYRPGAARALDWLLWGVPIKVRTVIDAKYFVPTGAIGVIRRGPATAGTGHVFQFHDWVDDSHQEFYALEGNANLAPDGKRYDGIVQLGIHKTSEVLGWRWPAEIPLPISQQSLPSSSIVKTATGIGAAGVTAIAANSGEIVDAVTKAKSISTNSIIGTIAGVLIVVAVIAVILLRARQKKDERTIGTGL